MLSSSTFTHLLRLFHRPLPLLTGIAVVGVVFVSNAIILCSCRGFPVHRRMGRATATAPHRQPSFSRSEPFLRDTISPGLNHARFLPIPLPPTSRRTLTKSTPLRPLPLHVLTTARPLFSPVAPRFCLRLGVIFTCASVARTPAVASVEVC